MGQPRQGFPLPRWFREASEGLLARRMVAQDQDGGVGERPREGGMADLLARSAIACASRCCRPRDEAAIGHERLDPRDAVDLVDLIEPPQGQDLADPWDGAPAGEDLRLRRCGGLDQRPRQVGQPVVVGMDPREVDLKALLDGRLGEALRHAGSVRLVGELLADRREVGLTLGLLAMGPELGPCARERPPAPAHVSLVARRSAGEPEACGSMPPRRSTAILWESIVSCLALPPCMAFMSRAWPKTKGIPSCLQRSASQYQVKRPSTQTTIASRERTIAGRNGSGAALIFWWRTTAPSWFKMQRDHGPGVQVDATVALVLCGVESPEVSSS